MLLLHQWVVLSWQAGIITSRVLCRWDHEYHFSTSPIPSDTMNTSHQGRRFEMGLKLISLCPVTKDFTVLSYKVYHVVMMGNKGNMLCWRPLGPPWPISCKKVSHTLHCNFNLIMHRHVFHSPREWICVFRSEITSSCGVLTSWETFRLLTKMNWCLIVRLTCIFLMRNPAENLCTWQVSLSLFSSKNTYLKPFPIS